MWTFVYLRNIALIFSHLLAFCFWEITDTKTSNFVAAFFAMLFSSRS